MGLKINLAHFKVVYLITLAVVLFVFKDPMLLAGLLILQSVLWFVQPGQLHRLLTVFRRLLLFIFIILLSYAFLPLSETDSWYTMSFMSWQFAINISGIQLAMLMSLRVVILITASVWTQTSSSPGDFLQALIDLRIPKVLAVSIDASLKLIGTGKQKSEGSGKHKKGSKKGQFKLMFSQIKKGDFDFVHQFIDDALVKARNHIGELPDTFNQRLKHDIPIIVGITVAIMSVKMIQIMPGLPIAPGHKNILIIPFFLLAARLTQSNFGALWTGLTVGTVSFLLGYGKFGILEIAQFALPGLLADILLPMVKVQSRLSRFFFFMIIGIALGITRFSANFLVIVLAGAPLTAFIIYVPMLFSHIVFGGISAFISTIIVTSSTKTSNTQKLPQVGR